MLEATASLTLNKPKLKRGYIREDGKILHSQRKNGSDYWMEPEQFAKAIAREKERRRNASPEKKAILYQKAKEWRGKNPEKLYLIKKKWSQENSSRVNKKTKEWRDRNKDRVIATERKAYLKNKKAVLERNRLYRQKKREEINAQKREYIKNRRKTHEPYAIQMRVRCRFSNAMKRKGWSKDSPMQGVVGCSWEELKSHLESFFHLGYSWENRSKWHIDHIIPCATATTEEEMKKLFHFSNLQPLWIADNLSKGAKPSNQYECGCP